MTRSSTRIRGVVIALAAALPLTLGTAVAQAHGGGWSGGDSSNPTVAVAGTIVSVDASTNSFVANAYIVSGPSSDQGGQDQGGAGGQTGGGQTGGGQGDDGGDNQGGGGDMVAHSASDGTAPTTTQVTITTDPSSTSFDVNDNDGASISDLAAGDKFFALFNGSSSDTITQLVQNNPAVSVHAHTPPAPKQLYAFVGTVTAVDTTAGTVSVNVTNSLPSGFVTSADNPVTYTVGGDTMILGGSTSNGLEGGTLSNVTVGDVVAGGEIGTAGETLSKVESTELGLLIDFPASSTTTTSTKANAAKAKAAALRTAEALLGYKQTHKKAKIVTDSHRRGKNNRVVKFDKTGKFIKEWGHKGSGPGELSEPHAIAIDSQGRLFVGDRENNRIQIFDQEGKLLDEWRQFGRPSGIYITKDDTIYVADSESGPNTGANELMGIRKGIRIGSARDGKVTAFIEDMEPTTPDHSGAEGVGVDAQGNVYGAVVRRQMLERHVKK